jgi:hypothetical protein
LIAVKDRIEEGPPRGDPSRDGNRRGGTRSGHLSRFLNSLVGFRVLTGNLCEIIGLPESSCDSRQKFGVCAVRHFINKNQNTITTMAMPNSAKSASRVGLG